MSCRLITSPITGERVKSKTWNDLLKLTNSEEKADALYNQLVSPEFISWFGDWVNDPQRASKAVNDLGEPVVLYHGTGAKFSTFDKSLRGSTTGKSEDGSFDAENAFFFSSNKNVAFNYAILGRQQELSEIIHLMDRVSSRMLSGEVTTGGVTYAKGEYWKKMYQRLREISPETANQIDGWKNEGFSSSQIMEKLREVYQEYYKLWDLTRGGAISNSKRYYNDVEDAVEVLESRKKKILGGEYTSINKAGHNYSWSTSMGKDSLNIFSDGKIYYGLDIKPELKSLTGKNITQLTSKEFDDLVAVIKETVVHGRQKEKEELERGGFTPHMIPSFVNMRSPVSKDFEGKSFVTQMNGDGAVDEISKIVKSASESKGVDGAILKNIADPEVGDSYAVFEPNQIKSVFNNGAFSNSDDIYLQQNNSTGLPVSTELDTKIKNFLSSIGVNVKSVNALTDAAGDPISGVAKASMLNNIIQVVEGKADISTLPEEASHFFVELLGEDNPLYQQMFKDITGYKIYSEVVDQYKDSKLYRRPDGSIDFPKLKREAIGKLISFHIISKETGQEFPEKLAKINKWWEKVWNYITNIFSKITTNPFDQSAVKILSADTKGLKKIEDLDSESEYLQIDNTFSKIKADQQRIHLDNSVDPHTGQKKHVYTVDGKAITDKNGNPRSVTSVEVDEWYKKKFPTDNRNKRQKQIDELKAQEGDKIHADVESIIGRHVDASTGELRNVPLPSASIQTNQTVYQKLEDYISQVLRSYPVGTKFLVESRIYDSKKNLAGSIDLLILKPDGTADIFDWKSQEVSKGQTDIKWFKEPAYRIQLDAYRRILTQEYGITKFGKVRAIPISTVFQYRKDGNNFTPTHVNNIEIGSFDPRQVPDDKSYLLPVVAQDESTGDKKLDKLISQLNAIYEIVSQKSFGNNRNLKAEELNKIKRAIRDLQVKQNITSFVENGLAEVKKYNDKLEDDSITSADVLESRDILEVFAESSLLLSDQLKELKAKIKAGGPDANELEELQNNFLKMNVNAKEVLSRMEEKMVAIGTEIAEKQGITNLLQAEKTMDKAKVLFRSLSTLPTRALKTFYKLLSTAQGQRDFKVDELNDKLRDLRGGMEKWADKKGIPHANMFDGILKLDDKGNWTGDFLDRYSKDFYTQRNEAIKNQDSKWISDNTTFDVDKYEAKLATYKTTLDSVVYSVNPQTNQERKDKALDKYVEQYDVRKSDFAKFNKKNYFLKPKEDWQSAKWKDLQRPENVPLKEAYEQFQKLNSFSEDLGMIEFDGGFIPSVRQDKIELAVFNGLNNVFNSKGLFESLQTDSDKFFGEINPLTGEQVKKIPVAFINDLGEKKDDGTLDYRLKSKDLFKVYSIWGAHSYNYEAMQNIKDSADLLVEVERSKKSLISNFAGNVTRDKKEKEGNEDNAKVLDNFVKYYVYGQKGDNSDYTFKIGDKEYSAVKTGRSLLSFMSIKTLGLNVLSGTATFVGGNGNAFFQASKRLVFNENDWAHGFRDFTARDPKLMGALGYFDVGLEDMKREHSNQLSVSGVVKHMNMDQLFIIQRNGDRGVQYPVLAAMMRTHMIEGDKIVDINQFVKEKYDYNNSFYNLSKDQQKEMRSKIDKEVKELKDTRSLRVVATIKDDKLELPGLDRKSQAVIDFRNKVRKVNKNIIGNATHDDINQLRMTMLGQVLMQFRSWMPQMVIERFGDMSYDVDMDSYQYGKTRLFLKHLVNKKVLPLIGELITGFGTNTIQRAKQRYIEFKARMDQNGEEFNMSEGEFVDMYLGSLRSMVRELILLTGFTSLLFWIKPGADDDKTGIRKYLARAANKYQNEFSFFYSPTEFTQMIKSPVPIIGLLTDVQKFFTGSVGQMWGFATGNDDLMEKSHPITSLGKIMPITKEAIMMYGLFDDDFRKNWGVSAR